MNYLRNRVEIVREDLRLRLPIPLPPVIVALLPSWWRLRRMRRLMQRLDDAERKVWPV